MEIILLLDVLFNTMRYSLLTILLFLSQISCAQVHKRDFVDSLAKRLPSIQNDTITIKALDQISYTYTDINPDTGIIYAQEMLRLARKINWQWGLALANADIGINYNAKSNRDSALAYELKALNIYERLKDTKNIAAMLGDIALIYLAESNYPKALDYNLKALELYEALHNKRNRAIIIENIGTIYSQQKNYPKALKYYNSALSIYQQIKDDDGIARCLGNIGTIMEVQGQWDEALKNHLDALAIKERLGNKNSIQITLGNIGNIHSLKHNYTNALKYHFKALTISREVGSRNSTAVNLGNIGETYYNISKSFASLKPTGQYIPNTKAANLHLAISYLQQAVDTCRVTHFYAPMIEFEQYLANAYYLTGNYQKAFDVFKERSVINDSIFSIQSKMKMADMEIRRELELKDKDLQLKDKQLRIHKLEVTQKRNESIIYIIGIVLLLLVLGMLLRSLYIHRSSNRALLNEKIRHLEQIEIQVAKIKKQTSLLQEITHMQAHDVREPVASILGLVQLFNFEDPTDPTNQVVIEGITSVTKRLDEAVQEVIRKERNVD